MTQLTELSTGVDRLPDAPPVLRLPGARFRPFRDPSDYERLSSLIRACSLHDEIPWLPTVANLRSEMEDRTSLDPRRDVLLVELDDRTIGVTGVERVVRDGSPIYEMWGSVHPDVRRRGLGTSLLAWSLARIRQRAVIEDPAAPIVVQGDAEEQETGNRVLLAGAGFMSVRHFFLMRRPTLDDVPDVPLPDGFEIRPVTEDQRRPILEAEFEAFKDHWGTREPSEEHFTLTLSRAELDTDLWVVAWDGDRIAGVVENWIWTDENAELGVKRGWLERISVRRPWRRRGLARALTARSLVRLREAGMEEGMLGVDSENANGALGLYEGLGFEVHSRSAAYRRTLDP
ncbi:MAG: GNAT family N-acetyltransferase [Chloroflexota bacterium]